MIKIVEGNILDFNGQAIVNAANENLSRGGGVCGAIFSACDANALEKECEKIGHCNTGDAVITSSCGLKKIKYIIHAVAPIYESDLNPESHLYNAYYRSLLLAYKNGIDSIAFPSLGTGIYGYPIEQASKIAIRAILDFLNVCNMDVYLYAYTHEDYQVYFIEKTFMEKMNHFITF